MLETILQRILGRYLEPYVYNLSRENLRLGVLSGNLVLENLKLKENLGDILHLPLTISSGHIGHVSITIPWTSLGYKPLVIKLKEIHVIAKPKDYGNVDEETIRKELRESKEKLIEFKEKRLNERFLNGELSNTNNLDISANNDVNNNLQSKNKTGVSDENSANGTNLLWRIIKKIVANIQIEVQDIHICMVGFQSKDENNENFKNSTSDIIMGMMIKSGFVVTTDSSGNKNFEGTNSNSQIEDPNALFKTVEINDVGIYIGQYFPNSFDYNIRKHKVHDKVHKYSLNQINQSAAFDLINIVDVRNRLLDSSENKTNFNLKFNETENHMLESKYLIIYDKVDTQKSIGAWRLEYILKPLTFHLNISHFPNNNELRGILQVHSTTEHTIILRRSHLRPIIFCIQSLNERQEKYREILLRDAHLVLLDPISLRTTTQDEYISLYSRKLKLEAIKLYNNEGNETNFFGIVIQPLTSDEINRLQILDDVISVRHIVKWRCKAKEAINRIIIEASSRKKLRNLSSDTKSVYMDKGNLLINNEIVSNLGRKNSNNNNSWTKWALSKIIGSDNNTNVNNNDLSSPSYLMREKGIYSDHDFTVTSNNSLITEEEMNVIITAVTNEKYFEKIDTPTKFSITFGLVYFGITIFDDVSKPILNSIKSDSSDIYNINMDKNNINNNRNITTKFLESIPNPSINLMFLSLKLHELYIQFNIQSVIDRNDKDCYEWNFSTYIKNLSLYHYKNKILFFDNINNLKNKEFSFNNNKHEKNPSIYNLGSVINTILGFESLNNNTNSNHNQFLSNSSIFLHITHNVNQDGNSLKFILKVSPLEIFIMPNFVSDMYSLLYLYNSVIVIPEKVNRELITKINLDEQFNNHHLNQSGKNNQFIQDSSNTLENNSSEFVEELIERSQNVKYFSSNNSLPDFIHFDIQILSPIFHIVSSDFKDNSLCSIQIILGNCYINTKTICELDKLDISAELSNTQIKYLTYSKNISNSNEILNDFDQENIFLTKNLILNKEFTILHPIPIFINMNIYNKKKEEINAEKDHLSIVLKCNLQQFILTINSETLSYLLHIPLSFYNSLALPNILGYYYLPQNTLNLTQISNLNNKNNLQHIKKNEINSSVTSNNNKYDKNSLLKINEHSLSNEFKEDHPKLAKNVLLLMNKTIEIECYTKSDILSFTILSENEQIDILQGSIKGISSYFSYNSIESVYQGKINLHRALLYSSYTNKPLLFTVTEYDPVITDISDLCTNIDKKDGYFKNPNLIHNNSKDSEISDLSIENDNAFVDAIEEYDNTLEIFFIFNSDENEENCLNISIISSPIEFYWDKPTILNLIECIKFYQEKASQIALFHLKILNKVYILNKFYFFKIENNLLTDEEIVHIYGNTFQLKNINDYYKFQHLMNMKNYLMDIDFNIKNEIETQILKIDELIDENRNKFKKELEFIISSVENNNNWIHSVILMPPKFNFIHIQNIYLLLNNIYNTVQDDNLLNCNINSDLNINSNFISLNKNGKKNNSYENFSYMEYSDIELLNLAEYYNTWMFSSLYNDDDDNFDFDTDDSGLPEFSFNYSKFNDVFKKKMKPKIKFTYIIKGGSLSLIKDEKIYITIGINNICVCLDIFHTGDKMVKFSINNCCLTINNKCILSRQNRNNDKPLLLMYINLYKPIKNLSINSDNPGNELNIALKCYMDSLCYIIYYKDVLEFIDYINDGILDTLISKSYKAAKDITDKRIVLYYLSFNNSIIKLPEDHKFSEKIHIENKDNKNYQSNYYVNPRDVFDETLERYKDILHDLLQEIYSESKINKNSNDKNNQQDNLIEISNDSISISNYLLNRINNKESLFLLEKPISNYPRFKNILYEVKLFDKTQSYCEIKTKNIKLFNKMIFNNKFIREFYEAKTIQENEKLINELYKFNKKLWITKLIIKDGVIDIVEKENGSESIKGKILLNISGEIEYGITKSFPKLILKRICNNENIEFSQENISLLNINMSPLNFNLSRQQLTFIINVLAGNFSNTNSRIKNNFSENDKKLNNLKKMNLLINLKLPLLSLETSFSHFNFDSTGYKSSSLPLLLVKLFDCRIRSNILSLKNDENFMKLIITSKKYYFDDIRLTSNLKYRRIIHGYTLGNLLSNDGLFLSNENIKDQYDEYLISDINSILEKDSCSIKFICEISNLNGNHILLQAFNPRAFFGFNCIIDFYYYLSHSWRSSYFSKIDTNIKENKKFSFDDHYLTKQDYNSDLSPSLLYRTNKECVINEFEELLTEINKQGKFNFEFKLEIINGIFGFTDNPQKKIDNKWSHIENLILIWETNINCSITTHFNDTIIRNLDLINCNVYFSEILENKTQNLYFDVDKFSSQLLKPILELNNHYKPISFEIPNINELKKIVIANSFDILFCGKYLSKIREIPEIYSTPISLSELIFILKIKNLDINITPHLLSVLIDISKNLFNDGPTISPLYTTIINNESINKVNDINEIETFNYSKLISNTQLSGPPPIRRIYDLKIKIEKINIKFLNEYNDIKIYNYQSTQNLYNKNELPTIKIEMSIPTWRIEIIPIKTNHTLKDVSMKISILDINNQIWEPIVEQCIFSIYYFYDHLILYDPYVKPFKKSHRKYFHSTFPKSILINIKPSIYHSLNSFISYFKQSKNDINDNINSENIFKELNKNSNNSKLFSSLYDKPILNLDSFSKLSSENNLHIMEINEFKSIESSSNLKYLNFTGLPYYCFILKENHLQDKDPEFKLEQLLLFLPNNEIFDLKLNNNPIFKNHNSSILLKYINNCNSQIPLLRLSLPNKLFCIFSAPIDKDILRLKREFKTLEIEFIIRVLVVYKSYNLAQNVLKYYDNLNNHNDICNNIIGPLPNGLNFTHFQENIVSSAIIDTIIPFHNLNYLKNIISTKSQTYKRLFSDINIDTSLKQTKSYINTQDYEKKKSLNHSITKSISKSFSKTSMKSIQNGIKKNFEKKFNTKNHIEKQNINNKNYVYNNIIGQIISFNYSNKLFCLISNNRIINKSGIPLEICFLNENNIPIQLFDISKISINKKLTECILNQEITNKKFKYCNYIDNNHESNKKEKLNENSDYIFDNNMNFNDAKTIPIWLNNNDNINTIISSINNIYNNEDDISGIFNFNNNDKKYSIKQKRFYYSYFLENDHMLSVPQIALLNNYCKVLFRPSIIGFFEIYNIHNQYNNDNDIEQMLFNKEIYKSYVYLMNKYNDENTINEELHHITYELLKIFKTSNGEFILDLYYTFWNNLITKFTDSNNNMDLSYLYSRGWTQIPIDTSKNINSTLIHNCNVFPDFKNFKKNDQYKENNIYFQSYLQTYNSYFPGNSIIKNVYIYPCFSFFNLTQSLMEIKVKSINHNLLYKSSSLYYNLKPLHYYNIYQLSSDMKLQFKVRIMLEYNSINEYILENQNQNNIYTLWSSPIDLNINELDTSFTLYCNNNNSVIDLQCIQINNLSSNTYNSLINSLIGCMQKNIIVFNLSTWFINKTHHHIVPIFENSPFPYINIEPSLFYIGKNYLNNLNHKHKIFLLNNRQNYLKIYFNSFENLQKKYKNLNNYIDHDIYLNEEKEILEIINSNKNSNDQNSNIGLLEIPPIGGTYSFPIINENKVYYFTVKSCSLFYNNHLSCNSKIITISPHIVIKNLTNDYFYWNSITFSDHNYNNDLVSQLNPNDYIQENNKYCIEPLNNDYITSQQINKVFIRNNNKNDINDNKNNIIDNKNDNNNKSAIKDQKILLFLSKIINSNINKYDKNNDIRWSQPIIISCESNGIYYLPIPDMNQKEFLINPKTYCVEIITSNGLFIIKIKQDLSNNLWDGVIFRNYCNYLSQINIETYHFEYKFEDKKKQRRFSLFGNDLRNDDLIDNLTIRYVIGNKNKDPIKIAWSSPFLYNSRNCRLYIIPKFSNENEEIDNFNENISGIMAFDINFHYNQNNLYQSKRYILSLPESDILKLCKIYPYLNSDYFLNKDIKKNNINNYPIATISITARKNGLYIDILPPRNHSSLLLNLLKINNQVNNNYLIENQDNINILNNDIKNIDNRNNKDFYIEDIYQKRINQINKFINDDVWSLIYTYYRKITLDISQIGISIISENRESEIIYIELSTIQFKKQEKNRNGIIETYKFVIGDIQIDNQYISSNSKFYINQNKYYGTIGIDNINNLNDNILLDDVIIGINNSGNIDNNNLNSNNIIPYVLLANRCNLNKTNEGNSPFITIKWSCSNARSQWETIIYNFDCELSDLELNFDFNVYKILNEFIEECKIHNNKLYVLDLNNILSTDLIINNTKPNMTFSIEKIKISSFNLFVWCSIPLVELNYIPEWFRIGLKILTVSNALELRGAPIKLEPHNLENSIGTIQNIINAFYEYYMAELLWRIGTVLGHSSFVNIPLVPLQIGKNTLNMAFSTISIVNSNITSLLSNLTLDTEYINSRQRELIYNNSNNINKLIQNPNSIIYNSNQASSLKQGFVQAGHNITQGILSLGNVITKPIEGAQKSGFTGFCSGLIKGVTSSVVRPIDHIGQALNNVIDGIQAEVNKPLGGYKQKTFRRRIPRMLYSHYNKIVEYNINDALLRDIIGSKFVKNLIQYFVIPTDNYLMPFILLFFPRHIALVKLMSNFSIGEYYNNILNNKNSFYKSQLLWSININNIREVKASSHGLLIELSNDKRESLQIPICKFSLIRDINIALDNSQNNASPYLIFRK